jgi:hypothetical protein
LGLVGSDKDESDHHPSLAEPLRGTNVGLEDVVVAGVTKDITGGAFFMSVTRWTNLAIARTQNFAGVEKGNNMGRICAASVVRFS